MSHNKRHGTAEQLRVIPSLPRLDRGDPDRTQVDIRPAPPRREGAIPSLVNTPPVEKRSPRSTPVANVIPFTKPRAIAAVAAANPDAVVIKQPEPMASKVVAPSAPSYRAQPASHGPATRVATGWTPPGAVPIVKPAAPVASPPATVYPIAAPIAMPAPVIAREMVPATVNLPTPVPPPPVMFAPPPAFEQVPQLKSRWAVFEQLGLTPPKINSKSAAKLIVNAYRLLGFAILTIIVVVLIGYIASSAFFYMSDSWIVPMAVTPSDEKVVGLQAQLAEQQNTRDRISDELKQAERAIAVQQTFQLEFVKAIKGDLEGRKLALGRVRALANNAASTRAAIRGQSSAYASSSRKRMQQEYAAGLIDRNTMLSGKFQIAQITSSNLSLAERQAEFETKAQELEAQTRSLDAIIANQEGNDTALSYEVLRIKQEYEASRLDLAKAVEARNTLKASLARQDKIVASLEQSSYLRAVNDKASVAFVPYGNLDNVEKGTSVYACRVGMVICRNVGEVFEVLPGEVQFKHPHRDKMLRGQLVELKVDDDEPEAASDDVLFVGGRPLLF